MKKSTLMTALGGDEPAEGDDAEIDDSGEEDSEAEEDAAIDDALDGALDAETRRAAFRRAVELCSKY